MKYILVDFTGGVTIHLKQEKWILNSTLVFVSYKTRALFKIHFYCFKWIVTLFSNFYLVNHHVSSSNQLRNQKLVCSHTCEINPEVGSFSQKKNRFTGKWPGLPPSSSVKSCWGFQCNTIENCKEMLQTAVYFNPDKSFIFIYFIYKFMTSIVEQFGKIFSKKEPSLRLHNSNSSFHFWLLTVSPRASAQGPKSLYVVTIVDVHVLPFYSYALSRACGHYPYVIWSFFLSKKAKNIF